jgi:hypothetical protein
MGRTLVLSTITTHNIAMNRLCLTKLLNVAGLHKPKFSS